jgi:hypothetical protein
LNDQRRDERANIVESSDALQLIQQAVDLRRGHPRRRIAKAILEAGQMLGVVEVRARETGRNVEGATWAGAKCCSFDVRRTRAFATKYAALNCASTRGFGPGSNTLPTSLKAYGGSRSCRIDNRKPPTDGMRRPWVVRTNPGKLLLVAQLRSFKV